MRLWEIDKAIEDLVSKVDPETGEATFDLEELDALQLQREQKIENLALVIKNYLAEANAIKEEEKNLAARRKATENAAERAKAYLEHVLNGETFKSPKAVVSYRTSQKVEVGEDFFAWAGASQYLRVKDPEPDKTALKAAIKEGADIPGVTLEESRSMQIK